MANKKFGLGLLVMALAFGMAVIGCDDSSTGGEADTWTKVTSLTQLNGTWKGSYTQTQTEQGITVKMEAEQTITINASAGTESNTVKVTMTFSGSNINTYWPGIKVGYTSAGYTANDSKHSVSMTQNISQSISLSDFQGSDEVQINQKGTKFRVLIDDDEIPITEIIFIKQ